MSIKERAGPPVDRSLWRWALRGILVLGSTTFSLGLAEVGLRLFYPQVVHCGYSVEDADLGWSLRPGFSAVCRSVEALTRTAILINAQGFRGGMFPTEKPPGLYRILMLGDSTTFGSGVDQGDTVSACLQAALNRRSPPHPGVEVINAGVPGYGTAQEWLQYRRWAPRLKPDLVVLMFLVANDLENNLCRDEPDRRPCFEVVDGRLVRKPKLRLPEGARVGISRWIRNDFHTYLFARERLKPVVVEYPMLASILYHAGLLSKATASSRMLDTWYATDTSPPGWLLTAALLDALAQDTRSDGTRFMLVVLPSRAQTTARFSRLLTGLFGRSPDGARFVGHPRRPQAILTEWAAGQGVPMVDALDALSREAAGEGVHLPDGHFNRRGNNAIAREIARLVSERPPSP